MYKNIQVSDLAFNQTFVCHQAFDLLVYHSLPTRNKALGLIAGGMVSQTVNSPMYDLMADTF